jgi:hypothetical protein
MSQLAVRERQPQHDIDDLVGDEIAQPDERARAVTGQPVRADRLDRDALSRQDLELGVAGDNLDRLANLARDVVADLRGVGDLVEVAATRVGHRLVEHLVEVVADTEGRGRHPPGAQLAGVTGDLARIGDALVCEAISK